MEDGRSATVDPQPLDLDRSHFAIQPRRVTLRV
jgi:hypothetical protein